LVVGAPPSLSGAARFDGQRFFVLNHASFPVMASDYCRALAEDNEGALWIGTDNSFALLSGGRRTTTA